VQDLLTVREEVRLWNQDLLDRPQLIAATKRDLVGELDPLPGLERAGARLGLRVVPVSAVTGAGLVELKRALWALVSQPEAEGVATPLS